MIKLVGRTNNYSKRTSTKNIQCKNLHIKSTILKKGLKIKKKLRKSASVKN